MTASRPSAGVLAALVASAAIALFGAGYLLAPSGGRAAAPRLTLAPLATAATPRIARPPSLGRLPALPKPAAAPAATPVTSGGSYAPAPAGTSAPAPAPRPQVPSCIGPDC